MFEAWLNIGMAAPYVMASTTWHDPTIPQCNALSPVLISAVPSSQQVDITWQPVDPPVDGYKLYYDQAGKAQLVADVGLNTAYTDTGLTNGQEYCYKVTSYYTDSITGAICESGFSSILCAIPNAGGQLNVGVDTMQTGLYVKQGKGKNAVTVFEPLTSFTAGEGVVIRAQVIDVATGIALQNATVDIAITGPELVFFTTGPSDVSGIAEVTWQTQAPNKKGVGGTTPGAYTATTTNVTATGYTWDGLATFADFDIN
jgi:hypothetical protein